MKSMPMSTAMFCALSLTQCAAVPLVPGAEKVIVSQAPAPPDCQFKGTVKGAPSDAWSIGPGGTRHLTPGALTEVKNDTVRMGANFVVVEETPSQSEEGNSNGSFSGGPTSVAELGKAFLCPTKSVPSGTNQASAK